MSLLVAVITLTLLVAVPAAVVFTWYRCHVRLRAKGYGRFVITAALLLSFLASFSLLSRTGNNVLVAFGSPTAWVLFVTGVARVAPMRPAGPRAVRPRFSRRRAGRRRALMPTVLAWLGDGRRRRDDAVLSLAAADPHHCPAG